MRLGSLVISLVVWVAGASTAPAQVSPDDASSAPSVSTSPSNAATIYRRAFAKYHDIRQHVTEEQWRAVEDFTFDPSRGPSTEVRQILNRLQPIVMLTKQAARREHSDFEVDYASAEGNYEHLGDIRSLMRVMSYDYMAQLADGDTRAAVEELATMYRAAGQVSDERVLIGSLVGSAMLAYAGPHLEMALDRAMIGPAEAGTLLRELSRLDADDPMNFRSAMAGEGRLIAESLTKRFAGDEGLERFRAEYHEWFPNDQAADAALDSLTPEKLQKALAGFAVAATQMAEALEDPDTTAGDATVARIKRDINRQEFAPLSGYFLALSGDRTREAMQRTKKELDERRALLTDIAEGRINPMALANAAVWYIRATLQLEQIDPDKRRLVDAYAAKHDVAASVQLAGVLDRHDVQTLLETLRTAASLERCDFSYAQNNWPYTFRLYHAGLLGCGRILVADAARLLHEQKYDEATQLLGIAYRMSADIASDGLIAGALTAHRIFSDTDALVDAAIDSHMLSTDQIALLAERVKSLSRGDPFHYRAAIAGMRHALDYPVTYLVQGLPKDLPPATKEQTDRAAEILEGMDADRVLSLMTVYQFWEPVYYRSVGAVVAPRGDLKLMCAGLESIFDVQAIRDAADLAPLLTEWARTKQMEQVRTAEFPSIAPIEQRAKDSLTDYRRCVLRLDRLLPSERSITGRGGSGVSE